LAAGLNHRDRVPFAQILVRRCVRLNINAVIAELAELFPCDRFSSAECTSAHAFGVDEQSERIAEFFHDRPRHFILRFPPVIESHYRTTRRYVFFASLPCEKVLHWYHSDPLVFQFLHLCLKRSRRNLRARVTDLVDQPMVTKNKDLSG